MDVLIISVVIMIPRMNILPWKNMRSVIVLLLVGFTTGCLFHFAFYSSRIQRTTNSLTACKNCGFNNDLDPLQEDTVPNIVYYIWCDRKIFDFKHYLSVKSVFRFINPDRVVIYVAHQPRIDKYHYNQWYSELIKEEALFQVMSIDTHKALCDSVEGRQKLIKRALKDGGIYIYENVILTRFPLEVRTADMFSTLKDGRNGLIVVKKSFIDQINISKPSSSPTTNLPSTLCPPTITFNFLKNQSLFICTTVNEKVSLYPRDLWNSSCHSPFLKLANQLMYNEDTPPAPSPSSDTLIPNIAHIMWVGGSEMDFLFYLCCLSLLHVVKVDTLFIHGDVEPSGNRWKQLKSNERIKFVPLPVLPNFVFGKNVKNMLHMSDVYRVQIMLKYGGIYSDTDVIWVKPIPDYLREYDAVAALDWPGMYNTYPDYINFGTCLGKKGAKPWQLLRDAMKDFKDDFFGYNGLLLPYKLYERHPDLIYLNSRLQVMCWELRCHPTWVPGFRSSKADHKNMFPPLQLNDSISFHWTAPTPKELTSLDDVLHGNGLFADIGKYVLRLSGIIV